VQPIDTDLVPSWETVDPRLQNAPWHTVDGQHYGVPYQWGSNVLLYNSATFPDPPTSWGVVFEEQTLPDGQSNMIHAQAPHPNCAYQWLEHSLSPQVQGAVATWFGSVPTVPNACIGHPLLGPDGCAVNGADNFEKIRDLPEFPWYPLDVVVAM